ncbi:MAG: hypothetical protein U0Q16_24000 [Bryobacteraceae bacterium]
MTGIPVVYVFYALLSAAAYVAATGVMKYFDRLGIIKAGALIICFLSAAVYFETVALRTERLGLILLLILGCECALGLVLSWTWFAERYTARELIGFALIIAGVGLVKG